MQKKIIRVKLKTIGYLNLKTLKFYKTKAKFIQSLKKSELDQFNKKVYQQGKSFMKLCLLELKLQKAKLIKGYSWRKSCIIASCKREMRFLKNSVSKENRFLLFG